MIRTTRFSRSARWARGLIPLLLVGAFGCADSPNGPADSATDLMLSASVVGTPVAKLVVTVTGPDIAVPLVFNLVANEGTASGTVRVTPGPTRLFYVEAFDSEGIVTHDGSKTVDVRTGMNAAVHITLRPRSGQVPLVVTLGTYAISLSDPGAILQVGETFQLSATVLSGGEIEPGAVVEWATTNPGILDVDASGLVTAMGIGEARIVATYEGFAGEAAFNVTETDLTGTYAGLAAISVTGNMLAFMAEGTLIPNIFGCSSPCPATVTLAPGAGPDYDAVVQVGSQIANTEVAQSGATLVLAPMSYSVPFTITGPGTLTCFTPVGPTFSLDLGAPGGPRVTGPATYNCSVTDPLLGTITGVVTLGLDVQLQP